jgi:hypothetical protein
MNGFQQRRLRFRRSAVDLIGEQEICKHRTLLEFEFLSMGVINGHTQDIARKHVAGALQPVKIAVHRSRQGLRERRFPDTRHVFDQKMPAGQQANPRQTHHFRLPANGGVERHLQLVQF